MAELEPTRFFVVHLQKTAGTSLRDRFRATFENDSVYPNKTDGPVGHAVISLSHLLERWQTRRDELRLIAGHFPLSTVDLLDAEFVTLSVLRPVVDRTLSYLRHQQKLNTDDRARSLEEIYDDPFRFRGLIRNHMTRMFSISAEEMVPGDGVLTDVVDSRDRLERAKEGLASLDAFGLQPRFEELWKEIADRFGLVLGSPVRSNVTTAGAEVPDRLVERILEDNALDLELYDYAERLYEDRATR